MTFCLMLDEMYPPSLAEMLRGQGHDVLAVAGSPDLAGSPDEAVLDAAVRDARCLVTENVRDFAILARHTSHCGILFINAERWPRTPAAIKRLADALGEVIVRAQVPGPAEVRWLS
jgi:predicted nuclease of predicted toxin-antitoxin system